MRAVGHRDTWQRLQQAIAGDTLAHAMLFCGPPGIGKAVLARDLAAALVCGGDPRPCGTCDRCRQVDARSHPDVRFVSVAEGKKEIGVDEARELKAFTLMQGIAGNVKVVVIDDADRLSIAAQNALLKTLEEPPGRAVLILVTASPGALLPTVRSRCRRIDFRPLGDDEVRAVLIREGRGAESIDAVLPLAAGSVGRAVELLAVMADDQADRLLNALASLRGGGYGAVVEFTQALGRTDMEASPRMAVLIEILQQRLVSSLQDDCFDPVAVHARVRLIDVLSSFHRRMTRGNANRGLLVEAAGIRSAGLVTDEYGNA